MECFIVRYVVASEVQPDCSRSNGNRRDSLRSPWRGLESSLAQEGGEEVLKRDWILEVDLNVGNRVGRKASQEEEVLGGVWYW